ncbi:Pfs, NACHT and WD domain protein [Trichoderma camerunense]
MSNPEDYTVGWICAISTERVAAEAFLDEKHKGPEDVSTHDNNDYALGKMGRHNVVIAVLPDGEYGTASAATVARDMLHTFPNIRIGLMVGIGGGAPSAEHDIRLGDIVVSAPRNGKGGVFQYDFGKTMQDQAFQQTGFLDQPPTILRTAIAGLKAQYEAEGHDLEGMIDDLLAKKRRLRKNYKRPAPVSDNLFQSEIVHPPDERTCKAFCLDNPSNLQPRHKRTEDDDNPTIHYGTIASANQLMNDAKLRDKLAAENDVLCFDTEAAGLMNHFPCLVIRGICDYSDSHKDAGWHGYAAMTAAAYAKDLLIRIPPKKIESEKRIIDLIIKIDEKITEVDEKINGITQSILSIKLPVTEGAAFDSHAEEHNPTCLPGTRVELLQHITNWTQDPSAKAIFWLNGMAGTGKSTVSRTIAKSLVSTGHLGASFFFKRGEGDRGSSAKLFTTIAAQLATIQTNIASYFQHAIKANSDIGNKGLREQFNELILQPLSKVPPYKRKSGFIVIVIDALDECELEDDVKLIIRLFNHDKSLGLRIFLTSRPELPIRLGFSAIQGEFQGVILHEISEPVIQHDLSVLIRHELQRIRDNYNKSVQEYRQLKGDWPGQASIDTIVKMAIPLFIFAATICRFLADRKCGNPDDQLRKVLEYETKSQESKLDATYLPVLNQQIAGLTTRERNGVLQQFKYIVGSIVLLSSPLSTSSLSQLLRISRDIIDTRLDMLHSVLSIPQSPESPIRLLHLSFRDFLVNPEKQGLNPFWIDEAEAHAKITDNCLHVMEGFLREDMCSLRSQGLEGSIVEREEAAACIPAAVQYACLNWVFHLQAANNYDDNYSGTFQFLKQHFLHWVEALSLIRQAPETTKIITSLQALIPAKNNKLLSEFLDDALRILQSNLQLIASAPLQIYSSALLFAPHQSIIKKLYRERILEWILLEPKVEHSWSPCIRTLEGHRGRVNSVAFSPNSAFIASASDDYTVRLWNANTGECIEVFKGHNYAVNSVAFSHDSLSVLSGSYDDTIRLWCIDTGKCVQTLEGHRSDVAAVAFSHDSSFIASASRDRTIRLWRVDTGECIHILSLASDNHYKSSHYIAFSQDSSLLASASDGNPIQLWDTNTGTCVQTFPSCYGLAFSHDLSFVASTSDGIVRVWRSDTGECVQEFNGHRDRDAAIAFSHDSSLIISTSSDNTIQLCNIKTGEYIREFKGHSGLIVSLAFSHDSSIIASASSDDTIRLWYTDIENYLHEPDYNSNKTIPPRRAETTNDTSVSGVDDERIENVAISHDSSLVASLSYDGTVRIWHADTGNCIREFRPEDPPEEELPEGFSRIHFSHDSLYVAIFNRYGYALWLWSVNTGECIHTFIYAEEVLSMAFSHDSSHIAAASGKSAFLRSVDTGDCVREFIIDEGIIYDLAFSHDPSLMVSASNRAIQLWNIDTGECIRIIDTLKESLAAVALSNDSSLIASINGRTIQLWCANTGECVQNFYTNAPRPLDYLSFTSDGLHLLTNFGMLTISPTEQIIGWGGYGFSEDCSWITWDGKNLLWLPVEYRPNPDCFAVNETTLGVASRSGRVWFIKFTAYPH